MLRLVCSRERVHDQSSRTQTEILPSSLRSPSLPFTQFLGRHRVNSRFMKYEQCKMELQKRLFCSSFVFPCIPFNIIMIRRTKRSAKFDCGKPYFPCSLLFLQATENQWVFYIWGISEATKIPSSLQIWINEFVYCAIWISAFQNNDGFQCISSNSSFQQGLCLFSTFPKSSS